MKSLTVVLSFCIGLAMTGSAMAQTFTGGLRGAVREAGGIIPGVTVELINEETGARREAVTNDSGEFNFAAVQPGNYTIRAALTGFKTYENTDVRIAAQQFITLDVTLEVGTVQETITVTGQAPLIDTSTASGGGVIDRTQLETLPSAGRAAFLFAVTIPTVIASGDPQFNRQQDQTNASLLSLGGGTRRGNNYLLDGVPITDMRNRASAHPSMEAIEDIAVQIHTYDAETGRTGGGTFNTAMKSGTNQWRGSGFWQTRPNWGASNNFFAERAGTPKPDTYYHLGGGGIGGPIIQNRTFFYFATEGYGSNTTRNGNLRFPTSRERNGDFSQTFDSAGRLVTIYDPLTGNPDGTGREAFPGNIIPADRIDPVSRNIASYLPMPDNDVSNGSSNFFRTAEIIDRAIIYSGKVDHRINDTVSLSGSYLYNKTDEPCADYWEPGLDGENRFADPGDYILRRRVHILALNNTWLPSNNTVLTLRYGFNRFQDNNTLSVDFDPSTLGFPSSFLDSIQADKFPQIYATDYGQAGSRFMGAIDPSDLLWHSWSANGTLTKLVGRHTLKFGGDFSMIGLDFQAFDDVAGEFRFTRHFTSSNPLSDGTGGANPSGNAFASLLLGYPNNTGTTVTRATTTTPLELYFKYYGFYAQDDFRVGPKLTLNYGLRVEHEDGLREQNDNLTVAFDRNLTPPGSLGEVVNPLTGQPMRGGLVYAGQNGAPREQGNQPALKWSPRIGTVYSFNERTVLRAGYGLYQSPWNYQIPSGTNYGEIGSSQQTFTNQGQFVPNVTMSNPFPNGLLQPIGNSLGALTGVGSQIEFIDQDKGAPYVQMYSVDINRELPANMAVGFEYAGATGRNLGLGGSVDGRLNINQLDPQHLALGSALLDQVPNPFFGLPEGEGFNVNSPTVTRAQLLRPFPQYGNIMMRQNTQGRNQYHAAIFKLEKRMSSGWGGRINYTFSRLKDNQFGETNAYSRNDGDAQNAYDVDAEYGTSILDVPHKLVIAPMFQLPFGEGRRWATSGVAAAILGDWTISSIITFESGFPIAVSNNSNGLQNAFNLMQRVNATGADAETSGSREDRMEPGRWLDAAAFESPGTYNLGTVPRTLDDVRTPDRNNWDFVAQKDVRIGDRMRGIIKLEVLNINNRVKTHGPITTLGSSNFGNINFQRGFMRLTQLTFRFTF